jgi:hypothetical protein
MRKYISLPGIVCLLIFLAKIVSGQTSSVININIFGGTAPFNNAQWNNWNLPANRISPVLKYADGSNSTVTITSNISLGITDNGTPYPTTMCPPEVGRFALLSSTTSHTLTLSNLKNDGTLYDLEIYASRRNTGNITRFTVNSSFFDINTASNYTNAATFTSLLPNASRQIVITITRAAGTYAYVNGLKLTEKSTRNQPPAVNAGVNQVITLPANSVLLSASTADVDGSVVSRVWTKIGGPAQFSITSPNNLQTSVTGLTQGIYDFELTATDDDGDIGKDTIRVTVNPEPPNMPPVVNAGSNLFITLPVNTAVLNGTVVDNDGSIASIVWTKVSGPSSYNITNPTTLQTGITELVQGIYEFELSAVDNDGDTGRDTIRVTINPEPPNQPPTVNAGNNQTLSLPANSVTLNGTGTDTDGSIASVLWTKISGPVQFTLTSPGNLEMSVTDLVQGIYEFELSATDDDGDTGKDTVRVTVNPEPPNQSPTVNAGNNQTIIQPANTVTLTGTATDTDGIIALVLWTKISGPASFSIASPGNLQTSVTDLVQGIYEFELSATDDDGDTGKDTIRVTVNPSPPNQPPTVNAGNNQTITLPASTVTLTGTATDTDGTITSLLWTKISGPVQFSITSPGNLQTSVTGLTQGIYDFELSVTDNDGGTGKDTVRITVNAGAYNIPITNASNGQTITFPASSVSVNATYTITGATLKNLRWSKTKVPGQQGKKVVWIGSSTLAGTGATTQDSAIVWRVGNYYSRMGLISSWVNLAVGGSNIYHGMPTGYTPSGNQNAPDVNNNVTAALNQGADIVIVGYQSNAYDGPLSIAEIMFAYRTIYNTVVSAGRKCYIFTSQPRPAFGTSGRNMLKQVADSIMVQFPDNYIQAYYSLVQTGTHNLLYNSGDNIHINNTGHRVLFNSVVARNIFESWGTSSSVLAAPNQTNTAITGLTTGTHVFQVSITDTHEQSATDTTIITVRPEPGITANAGIDQNVNLPAASVTLNGSASEGGISFSWTQLTGPGATVITSPSAVTTTVTGITVAGTYSFELSLNGGASRDTVLLIATIPGGSGTGKTININIFGGSNAYNNTQWNNWNLPANRISPALKYADGANSTVTITSNISLGVTDNGTPYPTTMCPPEVGRYALLSSTGSHTLTFSNLKTDGTLYDLEIYASRRNTGNVTRFTVNGKTVDVNTASNYANAAKFTNLQPNLSGQIIITITRAAGAYAYVNGLKLTEVPIIYVGR